MNGNKLLSCIIESLTVKNKSMKFLLSTANLSDENSERLPYDLELLDGWYHVLASMMTRKEGIKGTQNQREDCPYIKNMQDCVSVICQKLTATDYEGMIRGEKKELAALNHMLIVKVPHHGRRWH